VLGQGKALRYGIGVGRERFTWSGAERVSRVADDSRMRIGTTRLNLRAVTGLSAAFGLALTLAISCCWLGLLR